MDTDILFAPKDMTRSTLIHAAIIGAVMDHEQSKPRAEKVYAERAPRDYMRDESPTTWQLLKDLVCFCSKLAFWFTAFVSSLYLGWKYWAWLVRLASNLF